MKNKISSFAALFLVLFSAALPAFSAGAAGDTPDRPVIQQAPQFSKYENDMAMRNPGYFTINPGSIRLSLVSVSEEPDMDYVRLQETPPKDLAGSLVAIDSIVNIASKVWEIVQQNAPVVNIETKYATAYPRGVTAASQLAQWSRPKTYTYGFYAENIYGAAMIDCKYKVTYTYNGAYKGKGKFLTGVAVLPTVADVGWGYKLYMSASVPDSTIANVGTNKAPVAAMQLKLNWKMATVLKEIDGASVYYMQGDGFFEEIANPWKRVLEAGDVNAAKSLLTPELIF